MRYKKETDVHTRDLGFCALVCVHHVLLGLDQNKKWKFEQQAELLLLMERRGKKQNKRAPQTREGCLDRRGHTVN